MRMTGLVAATLTMTMCAALGAAEPNTDRLGQRISNVSLEGNVTFSDFRGKRGTVIVFLSFDCPVTTSSCSVLADVSRSYPDIGFLGLTCETAEKAPRLPACAREYGLPFRVLNDSRRSSVDALKAKITPGSVPAGYGFRVGLPAAESTTDSRSV